METTFSVSLTLRVCWVLTDLDGAQAEASRAAAAAIINLFFPILSSVI